MSEWIPPKINWSDKTINGQYVGDYFNVKDFNRIRNNILFLYGLAEILYDSFEIRAVPEKTYSDYLYATDMENIHWNIDKLADVMGVLEQHKYMDNNVYPSLNGTLSPYQPNQSIMTADVLNEMETIILKLYNLLINQYEGRTHLAINLGNKGDF